MYEADGLGLAAQQIGRPIQMCVLDVTGVKDRTSVLRLDGKAVKVEDYMPLVLINPRLELLGKPHTGIEGCLSFPGLSAGITRSFSVRVTAQDLDGGTITFEADGLLARALQHEHDHLHGILFIDRMEAEDREELQSEIEDLRTSWVG